MKLVDQVFKSLIAMLNTNKVTLRIALRFEVAFHVVLSILRYRHTAETTSSKSSLNISHVKMVLAGPLSSWTTTVSDVITD